MRWTVFLCAFGLLLGTTQALVVDQCSELCNYTSGQVTNVNRFSSSGELEVQIVEECVCHWMIETDEKTQITFFQFSYDVGTNNDCLTFSVSCKQQDSQNWGELKDPDVLCSGSDSGSFSLQRDECRISFSKPRSEGSVPQLTFTWKTTSTEDDREGSGSSDDTVVNFVVPLVSSFFIVVALGAAFYAYDGWKRKKGERTSSNGTRSSQQRPSAFRSVSSLRSRLFGSSRSVNEQPKPPQEEVRPGAAIVTHGGVRPRGNVGDALFATAVSQSGQLPRLESGMFAQPVSDQSMFNMRLHSNDLPLAQPAKLSRSRRNNLREPSGPLNSSERNRLSAQL